MSFCRNVEPTADRRAFLRRAGCGFGLLGLTDLLGRQGLLDPTARAAAKGSGYANPLLPKTGHLTAKAKSVIFLFMYGGPSQVDTFDYKPDLKRYEDKEIGSLNVDGFGAARLKSGKLMPSPFRFRQHGESGTWVCDRYRHLASVVDELAILKSVYTDSISHGPALFQMNTGMTRVGFPSVGSWVTYGLGTENEDMPGYVVMYDYRGGPIGGPQNWGSGFLPATYQATPVRSKGTPILNLRRPERVSRAQQRAQLDLINEMNRTHHERHPAESDLQARIESFELAYRMQTAAPAMMDLSGETEETKRLYGIESGKRTAYFGAQCLMARRMVERGVRFVQLYSGGGHGDQNWDAHGSIVKNHGDHIFDTDQPIAGLILDLKRRGLLEQTLIVWGGEFGRTPQQQGNGGRDHHPFGCTMFMAGGGIRGGVSHGATDEIGYNAADHRVSVHDIHATILHQLGIRHEELTYMHLGRPFRLTDVSGTPIRAILA